MKAAGFGAVEQILLANGRDWGTPAFRQRTRAALLEANRLGLEFDATLGPGWPISSPSIEDLSKEASVQDLITERSISRSHDLRQDGPGPHAAGGDRRRLIAVTAIASSTRAARRPSIRSRRWT